jgi:osmotically-inducible protein OsmY
MQCARLLAATVMLWAAPLRAAGTPQPEPTRFDARLRSAVQERYLDDARVRAGLIEIQVTGGRVTLLGTVPSLAQRAAAVQIASEVRGVVAIRNLVRVLPPRRSDRALLAAVLARIRSQSDVSGTRTRVGVRNQVVTLSGTYPTLAAHDRVVAAVADVEGVRDVKLRTQVRPTLVRPDIYVRTAIASSLVNDAGVDARAIRVGVRNGRAVLEGSVTTLAAWLHTDRLVRDITGVRTVDNRIRVVRLRPAVGAIFSNIITHFGVLSQNARATKVNCYEGVRPTSPS